MAGLVPAIHVFLALHVLQPNKVWMLSETSGWSRIEIDDVIKSGERKDAKLKPEVPLHWVYITAWATADGVVQFRDDIYNRDGLNSAPAASRG